jgi:hypothetical protein
MLLTPLPSGHVIPADSDSGMKLKNTSPGFSFTVFGFFARKVNNIKHTRFSLTTQFFMFLSHVYHYEHKNKVLTCKKE